MYSNIGHLYNILIPSVVVVVDALLYIILYTYRYIIRPTYLSTHICMIKYTCRYLYMYIKHAARSTALAVAGRRAIRKRVL